MSVWEELTALLASDQVTVPTRKVLNERLNTTFQRRFLSAEEYALLETVAARLVPSDPALFSEPLDLAGCVDDRLSRGLSDGWRYADTPPDAEAVRHLLAALPRDFLKLSADQQDVCLHTLQRQFPRAFEDLLAELTETYFAHPLVQYSLGIAAFADAPGWTRLGLNEREAREPDLLPDLQEIRADL
jgi:gluconate 2-dehydrogenase gamma chain